MSEPVTKDDVYKIVRNETLSEQEVESAVEEGVKKALIALGINHENAIDTQEDMAYLRRLRKGSQALTSKVAFTVIGAIVTAIIGLIVAGFIAVLGNGHTG